jgi:hypothetical protein
LSITPEPSPPLPPGPPSRPRSEPPRWAWWVGGILIPVIGILVTLIAGRDTPSDSPQAHGPGPAEGAGTPTAPQTPTDSTPSPVAPTRSASPASTKPSPAGKGPAGYTLEEYAWGISAKDCASSPYETQLVDLDGHPSRTVTGEPGQRLGPAGRWELVHWQPGGCMEGLTLQALPNVQAGVLRSDQPKSFEACRKAAGTGFGPLDLSSVSQRSSRGVAPGAAVCSVTNEGSVAMAVIEHIDQAVSVTASPSVTGTLHVWSKTP